MQEIERKFKVLSDLMNRADVDSLVCATDAGREGELIFRLVYQQAGCSAASGCLRFSARLTLFAVEDWDSRIYSYEGDVPGAFSVPAYYGKGAGLYALVTYRPVRWLSMSLKCHAVKYTGRARDALGVRFQLTVPF